MSVHRHAPYKQNNTNLQYLLGLKINIPMNQRQYDWGKTEIKEFLDDIF